MFSVVVILLMSLSVTAFATEPSVESDVTEPVLLSEGAGGEEDTDEEKPVDLAELFEAEKIVVEYDKASFV